jgi:GNAT superfamily N-acetyltransferase
VIRRAGPGDLESLLPLVRSFYALDRHPYDDAVVRGALGPLLADDRYGQVWLLLGADGRQDVTGYAIVTWSYSLESGGPDSILDEIYVADRSRGQGSALLAHAMDAERAGGARVMYLETEEHNSRVRTFYARHGFAAETSVWMSRELTATSAGMIRRP